MSETNNGIEVLAATGGGQAMMAPGGGLSGGKLALATAETDDVLAGKTYYAGDKIVKTGTLALSGNAGAGQVLSGYTFYNNDAKSKVTGSLVPRLKLLKSASRIGSGKISITVTGYSVYYYVFDDYDRHDQAAKAKSQGSWGLVLTSRDLVIAECYGCNPNTNTTFTMTYYLGGDFGRNAWVYVIA